MSVIKQVSKSIQALAALIASGAASTGTNGLLVRLSPDGLNATWPTDNGEQRAGGAREQSQQCADEGDEVEHFSPNFGRCGGLEHGRTGSECQQAWRHRVQ